MPHQLFISYSSAQATWARTFHGFLSEALPGLDMFFDQEGIRPGDDIQERLESALRRASHVLLLASPEALASQWVLEELKRSRDKDAGSTRGLIAARIVPVELPGFLLGKHVADLSCQAEAFDHDLRGLVVGLADRFGLLLPESLGNLDACKPRLGNALLQPLTELLSRGLSAFAARKNVCQRMDWQADDLESSDALGKIALVAQTAWARASRTKREWLAGEALLDALQKLARAVVLENGRDELALCDQAFQKALAAERERLRTHTEKHPEELRPTRGPTPDELRKRYLAALEDEHRDLIPLAEDTGRNERVEHVYVELALTERERLHERERPLAALGLAELLRLGRNDGADVAGRWLLRGDPGAGKSTLLRHFAYQCARGEISSLTPIFLSLARLFHQPGDPDMEEVSLALVVRAPDEDTRRAWGSLLRDEEQRGQLLLLLDGLDEVPTERMDDALAWLRSLGREWPRASLVVTTRKVGYRRPSADFVEVDLQPLGRERRVDLLAHWLPLKDGREDRARAEVLADDLSRVQSLRELAGNPLHLTLFALLASDPQMDGATVERRSQLYTRILNLLLRGGHKPQPDPRTPFASPHVRKALRHLAYGATVDDVLEPTKETLLDWLEPTAGASEQANDVAALRARLVRLGGWGEDLSRFLDELAKHTSILGPYVAGPDGPWKFLHKSFREALTAEQLKLRVDGGELQAVLDEARRIEGDEGRWAEPFALLAGSVRDPDALIRALEEVRPSLARAALATAEGVSKETAERMLNLEGNIQERGKVILGLVDRMASPAEGVRLLARLASESRDGNDLYFYYEALREAERWPECATLAREARRHFFDGSPSPADRTIFERVETCKGQRDLWARVEAGIYEVGSPDGVGNDRERPRHEVELSRPFRIGIVPVTNAQLCTLFAEHSLRRWEGVNEEELARHPAVEVTWYEAMTFARWLAHVLEGPAHFDRHHDWAGRLPTEAMWEVACRAGNSGRWCFGDDEQKLEDFAWFRSNAEHRSHLVGFKEPNAWGLHDVHGSVWEWCSDASRDYTTERVRDPEHLEGDRSVVRGGSFGGEADWCRSAYRNVGLPGYRLDGVGFRVALPAEL